VAEITQVESGPGWSLHAKTGWQNAPGPGVGWWVGWVQKGDQITPFALNIAMAGAADAPKRERLGRSSLLGLSLRHEAPLHEAPLPVVKSSVESAPALAGTRRWAHRGCNGIRRLHRWKTPPLSSREERADDPAPAPTLSTDL
jgi:hypothetical protein